MPRYYHIYPKVDLVDHCIDDTGECCCNPRQEFDQQSDLVFVIHDNISGVPATPEKDIAILKRTARVKEMRGY